MGMCKAFVCTRMTASDIKAVLRMSSQNKSQPRMFAPGNQRTSGGDGFSHLYRVFRLNRTYFSQFPAK
eukprot:1484717-Amphidinium_carterae.1